MVGSAGAATTTSGAMPSGAAELCCGVNHRSVVIRRPPPLGRSFQIWTVFLPNVGSPDEGRAAGVLERAGDDLGGGRGALVDQEDELERIGLEQAARTPTRQL